MSKTVDERVVSMQFDNKHFESNVKTTMSTLDKLKQSLNLNGAAKGLSAVNSAAKNCNLGPLSTGVESVTAKFSALQVMGVTALANITNSAVNAGKRIVSALTIDPVKTGFQEYETQINAVQTILANTSHQGTTIDDVNKALDELNKYADLTIYNFTEMTRNIGTFTAAGLDLKTSTQAIQGIANLAAVSGSTSHQASTAMYQLSQALSAGTIRLMDWNSVVNAGMGGKIFQNAIIETAKNFEGVKQSVIDAYNNGVSFRELLNPTDYGNWFSSELLAETLQKFTKSGSVEYLAKTYSLSEDNLLALQKIGEETGYTSSEFKKMASELANGNAETEKAITDILTMSNTATDAATKVKTFTQLWDVLKEAAQSGWSRTWRLIIGDFEEAKNMLTPLADFFTNVINKMSDARNNLLESALGKSVSSMFEGLNKVIAPIETISTVLEDLDEIVNKVIVGDFGNGADRFDALTKAGYNYYRVQNKVNETLGYSFRHSEENITAQDKLLGKQTESTKKTEEQKDATVELTEANKEQIKRIALMTEEQLRSKGYTEEQIETLKELGRTAEKLGIPLNEFIDNLDQINGRWLLMNSFKNIGQGLVAIFTALGKAWKNTFDPITGDQLFNVIAGLHKFTSYLKVDEEAADKFRRTFEGVFAVLDIVLTVVGGPLKIAFKILTQLLGAFDINILDVTATIGDALIKFRDWIDSALDFSAAFEKISGPVKEAIKAINEWINNLKNSDNMPRDLAKGLVDGVVSAIDYIKSLFKNSNIPGNIIDGFVNGLKSGASKAWAAIVEFGTTLLQEICDVLGIESPSTEFFEIGEYSVQGFIDGVKSMFSTVWEVLKGFGQKCIDILMNIDIGQIIASALGGATVYVAIKIGKMFSAITTMVEGLGGMFSGVGEVLSGFEAIEQSFSKKLKADAIKSFAIAIGILVASVVVLTLLDTDKMLIAVGVIITLSAVFAGLSTAIEKFGTGKGVDIAKFSVFVLALGAAMLMMSSVAKNLSEMSQYEMEKAGVGLAALGVLMVGLVAATKLIAKTANGNADISVYKVGSMLMGIAAAMMILVVAAKIIAGMTWDEMEKAGVGLLGLGVLITGLIAATKLLAKTSKGNTATSVYKVGSMLMGIATAMLMLVAAAKIIAGMSWDDMEKAVDGLLFLGALVTGLIASTKLAGKDIDKVGGTILKIGAAMLLLSVTAKIIAGMELDEMAKAGVGITALAAIIVGLVAATKLASDKDIAKAGMTLLLMSVSIAILAVTATLLGLLNVEHLAKGIVAVGILSAMMSLMIVATRGAQDCHKNLIVMSAAIAVMVGAVAVLSLIDTNKLIPATAALSMLMAMFAVIVASTSMAGKAMGTLIVITGAIAVLAGLLYILASLPVESTMGSAIALSLLMGVLAGIVVILGTFGGIGGQALLGVLALAALAIPLLAFVGVLALMQNIQNAVTNAIVLVSLATALTLLLIPLTIVGGLAMTGAPFLGVLALLTLAIPLVAFVGILALMEGLANAENNVKLLITLMTALTVMATVLSIVGPLAIVGTIAVGYMTALIVSFGVLLAGIGALMEKFPSLETFIDTGLALLEKLAFGLGSVISKFTLGLTTNLPEIGANLSAFMTSATPFINGVKMVDGSVLAGVGILTASIALLTAANIVEGIGSFLTGDSSFAVLGMQLSQFMISALPFITYSKTIDPSVMDGVKAIAQAILILTAADVLDGLTSWFTGGSSLADFGNELVVFGPNLKKFADSVIGVDGESVKAASEAIKQLALAANEIPNEGGLWGKLVGENSLATFGSYLPGLGSNLASFVTNLGTFTDAQVTTVNCAATAIKDLSEAANEIPNDGGLWSKLVGENSLATFGSYLPDLGANLAAFVTNLGTFTDAQVDTVSCAATAIKDLALAANEIPNEGGLWAKIVGDNSLATFGESLGGLGSNLAAFVANLGTFTDPQVASVNAAVRAIESFASLGDTDLSSLKNNISGFGDNLSEFGTDIADFVTNISGEGINVTGAVDNMKTIISAAESITEGGVASIRDLGESLKDFAKDGVKKFVNAFTSYETKTDVKDAASKLATFLVDGLNSKKTKVKDKAKEISEDAAGGIKTQEDNNKDWYNAGTYVVSGFANGITDNTFMAEARAKAMAKAALEAAEEELDENSPSKEFYRVGAFAGQGFINAFADYESKAYKSGSAIASFAKTGLTNAISRISDVINSDIDAQPTIRPVLDLSDVNAGVNQLDGMFGMVPSVALMSNVGMISSMMNRNQNGANDDVVLAIKDLGRKIGNMSGDTYTIGGVTYDDGSNISEAVKSLVRAAKVERRI